MQHHEEQEITPWVVKSSGAFDYQKVIADFGCVPVDRSLVASIPCMSSMHRFLDRGILFAHRDFDRALSATSRYLYTGRGPSAESMHLGHAVPFLITREIQTHLKTRLVIQLTDDEKYLFVKKKVELEALSSFALENAKDIAAFGFNPADTFIFINTDYVGKMYREILEMQRAVSLAEAVKVFGFDRTANIGQIAFPAVEMAPCIPRCFKHFLSGNELAIVPASIDQDPYFRLVRDKAHILRIEKPSTIYSSFLPGLQGVGTKMSSSDSRSSIDLNDTPETVRKKIQEFAFSGGRATLAEHKKYGGSPQTDVSCAYLRFFEEDEKRYSKAIEDYRSGLLLTRDIKNMCITLLSTFILDFQKNRRMLKKTDLELFFDTSER